MPVRRFDELGRCWSSVPEGWGAAGRKLRGACSGVICYPPGELCTPDIISTRTNSRALTEWSALARLVDVPIIDTAPAMHVLLEGIPARQWGFAFDRAVLHPALSGHAWQPHVFVATKVLSRLAAYFCHPYILLSRQKYAFRDKSKLGLSRQNYVCRDKYMSWQKYTKYTSVGIFN